jgi:hypothetical protein
MTVTAPLAEAKPAPTGLMRKSALVAGVSYLISFVSIPTLALYDSVRNDRNWIIGSSPNTPVLWGCFLEVIVALAGIGTAVALYPVVKRQNRTLALGFVSVRVLEAAMIFTGVLSLLSLVTLHRDLGSAAGADKTPLVALGASHVAMYNWTFQLGQTLMPCMSALLLGSLMYRSGLVPRIIPLLGLIGAPVLLSAVVATLFGHNHATSAWSALGTVPVAGWELSLGLWLTFKGFKPTAIMIGPNEKLLL